MADLVYRISADRQTITLEFPGIPGSMTFSAEAFGDLIMKLAWLQSAMLLLHKDVPSDQGDGAWGSDPVIGYLH